MNDQTLQLLSALAEKIGITTEYIWIVLVKQAPISGIIDLLVVTFWIFCIWISFKFIKRKTVDEDIDAVLWGYMVWGVISAVILIVIGRCISDQISSIINPEYWALQKITGLIKLK